MISTGGTSTLGLYDFKSKLDDFGRVDYWKVKPSGYQLYERAILTNGDEVKSTIANNTNNPNVNMIGWFNETEARKLISYASRITPRQFGGKPNDPLFDNYQSLTDCISDGRPVFLDGKYYTSKPIVGTTGLNIAGINQQVSQIVKTTNLKSGLASNTIVFSGNTKTDIYDVDAVLILKPTQVTVGSFDYVKSVNLSNFSLQRTNVYTGDITLDSIGLYAPRICQSQLYEFVADNKIGHGIYCANPWMISWVRCEASGRIPWCLGRAFNNTSNHMIGGTSNTLISPWAMNAKKSCYVLGLQYSTIISSGADYTGSATNAAEYVFDIEYSNITLISPSAEILYGKILKASSQSSVTIVNPIFDVSQFGNGTTEALIYAVGNETKVSIVGGKVKPAGSSANSYFTSEFGATIDITNTFTADTFTGFETAITNSSKTKLHIYGNNARIIYKNNGTTLSDAYNATDSISQLNSGFSVKNGGFLNTGTQGNIGITNYDGGTWNTNLFRLGRSRIWRANVGSNAAGIFHRLDSDPSSAENGTLLSSFRGFGANFPVDPTTNITGQYFYRTDLGKIFIFNGTTWKDANGAAFSATKPIITGKITPTTLAEQNTVLSDIVSALITLNLITDSRV